MFNTGNILTACAILVSAAGVLFALRKDRELRLRDQADRIRNGVAIVVAKLDRWKQLSLHLFDELQVTATEVDAILVKNGNLLEARDFFWKEAVGSQMRVQERILSEQIEVSYSSLYGYDPRIQDFYSAAVAQLRKIGECCFVAMLNHTQADVLGQYRKDGKYPSARLGNQLRLSLMEKRALLEEDMTKILSAFRVWMLGIVTASDMMLIKRLVPIPSADLLFSIDITSIRSIDSGSADEFGLAELDERCIPNRLERNLGRDDKDEDPKTPHWPKGGRKYMLDPTKKN